MSSPEEQHPYQRIGPMPPAPAGYQAPRPGAVTAAAVLWVVDGVLISLAFGLEALTALGTYGNVVAAALFGLFAFGGVTIWRSGNRLRHGHDKRVVLTVLGLLSGLAVVTLLLVVPAIVLQYRPASRRWFALTPAEAS